MPALEPNPAKINTNTSDRVPRDRSAAPARSAANDSPPAAAANTTNPSRIATAPAWVMAPYHKPASRTERRSRCSASTSTREVSAISSQSTSSVLTLAAAGTSSIVATNSGNTACAVRDAAASTCPVPASTAR